MILSALAGALVAVLVTMQVQHPNVPVRAAAATHAATESEAPAPQRVHSVTFIGDSWTEGFGATALRGYAVLTGEDLGWDYRILGVGSSGYDLKGRGATFDDRVDRAMETHPDVVVVQGSLNEKDSTPASLAAAADQTMAHLVAAAGTHTKILIMGASYTPGVPDATTDWINAAIHAAADKAGLQFLDVAALGWSDPTNPAIWADGAYHLNDEGCQQVADDLAPILRGLVGS